jgi:multidrug transporter EmrE-like cation transporter
MSRYTVWLTFAVLITAMSSARVAGEQESPRKVYGIAILGNS